jgi:hypothetical protein
MWLIAHDPIDNVRICELIVAHLHGEVWLSANGYERGIG